MPQERNPRTFDVLERRLQIVEATTTAAPYDAFTLAANASAGATTITLDRTPVGITAQLGFLAIDTFTTECEIRKVQSISGTTVTLATALTFAHASNDQVVFVGDGAVPGAFWGVKGDAVSDDTVALQAAFDECGASGLWLDLQNKTHFISAPMACRPGLKLRHGFLGAKTSGPAYAPADTNNAMLMNMSGSPIAFTATAADDTFTFASAHGLTTDFMVMFKGSSLPGGVMAGRAYYTKTAPTSTTATFSATQGGATLDVTSDGSGTGYTKLYLTNRLYLDDIRINGNNIAGINGVMMDVQQPGFWNKVYIEKCPGFGLKVSGQQYVFYNTVVINCGTGMVFDGLQMTDFYGTNVETILTGDAVGLDFATPAGTKTGRGQSSIAFFGLHFESITTAAIRVTQGVDLDFYRVHINSPGPLVVCNGALSATGYKVMGAYYEHDAVGLVAIDDSARGYTGASALLEREDFGRYISYLDAPVQLGGIVAGKGKTWFLGEGKRFLRIAGDDDTLPGLELRAATSQTADQFIVFDSSGVEQFEITKEGWTKIGGGATLKKVLSATATYDPPSLADGAVATTTVTVTGATVTNSVARASLSTITATGWIVSAMVTAADTVSVTVMNKTGGAVDLASGTLRVEVTQF